MNTLADILPSERASATALIIPSGGPQLTFAELESQIGVTAEALRRAGVRPGDPISIVLPNGLEFMVAFLAVTQVRAIAAPLNPAYTVDEFLFYMEDTDVKAVIMPAGEHPARVAAARLEVPVWNIRLGRDGKVELDAPVRPGEKATNGGPEPDDVALFLHTSGTTSRPKGVPLTHGNLVASLKNIVNTYRLSEEDRGLIVMPLFHVHGLLGATLSTLSAGGSVVIPPRFSASSFWQDAKEHGANWYSAVPTIHQILLNRFDEDGGRSGQFRFVRSCSSALVPIVFERLEERLGAPVLEAYGMTEASHQMTSNPLPPGKRYPGTVGQGTGVRVTILDDDGNELPQGETGEVAIQGPNVTKGYHNNPTANAEAFTNGWFRTGDQGHFDENGYLVLSGRIKELINRGGEKISPLEIDAVLMRHPAVAEAVCFAVPHDIYGEEVEAAVVLRSECTPDDLLKFCNEHLAAFKAPKRLHIADELPRTATGKIQRRHVAAHFREAS